MSVFKSLFNEWISNLFNSISIFQDNTYSVLLEFDGWFDMVWQSIGNGFTNVGTWFSNLSSSIGQWFLDLGVKLLDLTTKLGEWVIFIVDNIILLPQKIGEAIGELLMKLFVPSEDYFTKNFEELRTLLDEKIHYNDLITSFDQIRNVETNTPNNITIDLYGKTFTIVDWSYIIRYQSTIYFWVRGFFYPFFIIFNFNQIYLVIRGTSYTGNGKSTQSHRSNSNKGGGGK